MLVGWRIAWVEAHGCGDALWVNFCPLLGCAGLTAHGVVGLSAVCLIWVCAGHLSGRRLRGAILPGGEGLGSANVNAAASCD